MSNAVIVSIARTPIGKAGRGSFNITHGATLGGHVAAEAVKRAGIDPALIEDSIWGCGYPEYVTGGNIARQAVIRAGLPVSIAATTVNRFCASGLQAVAMGAHLINNEGAKAVLEGWTEMDGKLPVNPSGGLKAKGHPIGATGVSMHVLSAMQLTETAGDIQVKDAELAGIFNMGGAAVANYVSILQAMK